MKKNIRHKLFNIIVAILLMGNVFVNGSLTTNAAEVSSEIMTESATETEEQTQADTTEEQTQADTTEEQTQADVTEGVTKAKNADSIKSSYSSIASSSIKVDLSGVAFSAEGNTGEFGESLDILSGSQVLVRTSFGVSSDRKIKPNQLMFRAELPANSGFIAAPSDIVDYRNGGPNGPDDTPVAGKEYVWIIYKQEMHSGTGKSFSFYINPSKTGITPDNTEYTVKMQAFNGETSSKISKEVTNTFYARVPEFKWNRVSPSIIGGIFNSEGSEDIPRVLLNYYTSPSHSSSEKGVAFAKELVYKDTFKVPVAADGIPLVLLKGENLVHSSEDAMTLNVDYTVGSTKVVNGVTYITNFTVIKKVVNTNTNQELSPSFQFRIVGAKLNISKILTEYNLRPNEVSPTFSIVSTGTDHTVTPAVAVDKIGTATQKLEGFGTASVRFSLKNTLELGTETNTKNTFKKSLNKIGNTSTVGTDNDKLAAYPGDNIVYQLGQGFVNYQKADLEYLTFTEEAGTSYDKSEIAPIRVTTGKYSVKGSVPSHAKLTVTISFDSGAPIVETISGTDLTKNKTITIPAERVGGVQKIEYKFIKVDPNFKVEVGPNLTYTTLRQEDETKTGSKFNNTATLEYKYINADLNGQVIQRQQTSSAHFYYKDKDTDSAGVYQSNKDALNLTSQNRYPIKNDVLLFEIELKNGDTDNWNIKTLNDIYTYNLSLYSGDTIVNGNSDAAEIDAEYLSDITGNMVLWDPADITQKYEDQSIISVSNTAAAKPIKGQFDVTFAGAGIVIKPGETLKLTYTMHMNDDFSEGQTLGNVFRAYDTANNLKGKGEYWRSKVIPELTDNNRNKSWKNLTEGYTSENPFPGDLVAFTVTIQNDEQTAWTNGITIVDSYDLYLLPYGGPANGGLTGIDTESSLYDKFDPTKELNLGVYSTTATIDDSQISITFDEDNNKFTIDLGTNELQPGEELQLIYTMQVGYDVEPRQKLRNRFTVKNGNLDVGQGRCELVTNRFTGKSGIADIVKSATTTEDENGIKPNLNALGQGEAITYKVALTNYRNNPTAKIHLKNLHDEMPDNIKYVANSTKIYLVTYDNKDKETERTELTEGTDFTVDYTFVKETENKANTLDIKLTDTLALRGRTFVGNVIKKREEIIIEYQAIVDIESNDFPQIHSEDRTVERENNIQAFFTEGPENIVDYKSGGEVVGDDDDIDDDEATNAILDSSATVSVINNKSLFGNISKAITENANANLNIGQTTKKYTIALSNYSVASMPIQKLVDILPLHETLDKEVPITLITPTSEYEVIYTLGQFTSIDEKELEKITITGYKDNGNKPLTIAKTNDIEHPTVYYITYGTVIDAEAARQDMNKLATDKLYSNNFVAGYFADDVKLNITGEDRASKVITDDAENNDWDDDATTSVRYQNSVQSIISSNYISPFVNVQSQKVFTNSDGTREIYQEYVPGEVTVNPGDIIAWKVYLGNSLQDSTIPILKGAKVIMTLPEGLSYAGYSWNILGEEVIPEIIGEPEISHDEEGNEIIVWETTEDISRGEEYFFTIRTATQENIYRTYAVDAIILPLEDAGQVFYDNTIAHSSEYAKYSYKGQRKDLSTTLSGAEIEHYVVSQSQIDIFGELGISSTFQVTDKTGQANPLTVTSRDPGDRIMELTSRDDEVRYGMRLNVEKADKGFTSPVFINRLPSQGDIVSLEGKSRGSEADVRLIGNGSFTAEILYLSSGNVKTRLEPDTDYIIEYFFGSKTAQFTDADWEGAPDSSRWLSATEVTDSGKDFEKVTAVRFRTVDTDFTVNKGESLFVSYDAKLFDYKLNEREALNSFAYNGYIGTSTHVQAEPLYVGIRAPFLRDRVTVTKVLLDQNAAPKLDSFTMDLVGVDSNDEEQYRETLTIDATDFVDTDGDGINDAWTGEANVYDLPIGRTYSVEEPDIADYKAPVYEVNKTENADGTTEWQIKVINEPIHYADVTLTKQLEEDTATPTKTSFDIDIIGKDDQGVEQYRSPQTLTLTRNGTRWEGSVTLQKLDVSLTYSAEEKDTEHYVPTYSVTETDVAYGKSWDLVVSNATILKDAVTIKKVLHENTAIPTQKQFTIDLVGTDNNGTEVSRTPYTLELERNGTVWEQTVTVTELPHGVTYSVEEVSTDEYLVDDYTVEYSLSSTDLRYGKEWEFTVENTPILLDDVTITKVLHEDYPTPNQTAFIIELIGTDINGVEVSRIPYTFNLVRHDDVWEQTMTISNLPHGLTYTVEEKATRDYKLEDYVTTYTEQDAPLRYGTVWNFVVDNTPYSEVEVHYVDEARNPLADNDLIRDALGAEYHTAPKAISGYEFKEVGQESCATEGKITLEEQIVVYVYNKTADNLPLSGQRTVEAIAGSLFLIATSIGIIRIKKRFIK